MRIGAITNFKKAASSPDRASVVFPSTALGNITILIIIPVSSQIINLGDRLSICNKMNVWQNDIIGIEIPFRELLMLFPTKISDNICDIINRT